MQTEESKEKREKKKMREKEVEAKEETVYESVFIHLNT